jgi:S-(hydroxymethyl)glutathione dehydrogenase/alcohol dehydrogenase
VKTKAAILEKLNEPLVIEKLEIPELDVGQALVKVYCAGICGKQIGEISGWYGPDKFLPHLLGHEGGGVVEEVGPGGCYVKKGDHVVMHWRKGVGIEAQPPKYFDPIGRVEQVSLNTTAMSGSRNVGAGPIATFTEYAVVSENRLTPVSNDIPFEIAALFGCAVTTALGLVNNEARLKIGQSIAVIGCGGVGLNVIRAAKMVGANPIVAVDKHESKLRMAEASGADFLVNNSEEDALVHIGGFLGKEGVGVVVECTGILQNIASAVDMTTYDGKIILLVPPRWGEESFAPHMGNRKMFMSQGGLTNPTEDIPRYERMYLDGKLDLDGIITDTFTLDRINKALDLVRSGLCGRCMIEF